MGVLTKVLVIYVGGTIGMQKNSDGVYIPVPNMFFNKVKFHSEMHDVVEAEKIKILKENALVLPYIGNGDNTVIYEIKEYKPLLDSSNMSCKEWIRIANDIKNNYDHYNGFVVLHGTDTLAYTASVLSFMLDNLQKPIIITGSQIPIFETRSDAKDNFLSSLIIAGCYNIPEVCVFFANKLLRGNRTAKVSSNLLDAFDSPNYHVLAEVGINVNIYSHYIRKSRQYKPFDVFTNLNPNVAMISFFPTITSSMLKSFVKPPLEGIVLQSYGTGNIPSKRTDLLEILRNTVKRGVVILNITQCPQGSVSVAYETGKALEELGIISGHDMTAEAALTKLIYILGIPDLTYHERIKLIKSDIRGELTCNNNHNNVLI